MNDHNKPTGPKGPMAESMQGATGHKRKSLNRETQIKIGSQLQMTYNEVVNQGVPDRFVQLIRRLETEAVEDGVHAGGLEGAKDTPSDKGS
jgi:Anti-sigma factor NepR